MLAQKDVWNGGERQAGRTLAEIRGDHRARYRFAAGWVKPGHVVIDAACGIGYGSRMIADMTPAAAVRGYDISANAILWGKQHFEQAPRCTLHEANCYSLPEDDASIDVALSFETLEHLDAPTLLTELFRVVKPGGYLIASTPNENLLPWNPGYTHHLRHYRPDEFVQLLRDAGFEFMISASNTDRTSEHLTLGWDGLFNIAVARKRLP